MKRMTKSRGDDLRKGRTQGAGLIRGPVRLHLQIDAVGAGDMTEFMNDGALLRRHQQQQQARRLEHLPHSIWHQPLSPIGFGEAIRIWVNLQ